MRGELGISRRAVAVTRSNASPTSLLGALGVAEVGDEDAASRGPTTARALVPVKPVSQRTLAIASGPESPGRTRSPTISWSRLALGNRGGEPVGALGAHAPSSRFSSSSASR